MSYICNALHNNITYVCNEVINALHDKVTIIYIKRILHPEIVMRCFFVMCVASSTLLATFCALTALNMAVQARTKSGSVWGVPLK